MTDRPRLDGLVPQALAPRTRKIVLEEYCVSADIGFHDFEIGTRQNLLITVEVWLAEAFFPLTDDAADAWDYDSLRSDVGALVAGARYNLQETLAHAIYDLVAARQGVTGLRVSTRKPDIYPDCKGVGVELCSF